MQISKQLVETVHMIARIFEREVDATQIDLVRAFVDEPLADLNDDAKRLAERAYGQIRKALDGLDKAADKKEWFDYLAAAYAELFLGVSQEPIAPFESVYLGREKALYGHHYFEVVSIMKESGFEKPEDFIEPEDHLAMEWSFLGFLLDGAVSATAIGDVEKAEEQKALASRFIAEHLSHWNDDACNDFIKIDDSNGFYGGFANLAKAVLSELTLVLG